MQLTLAVLCVILFSLLSLSIGAASRTFAQGVTTLYLGVSVEGTVSSSDDARYYQVEVGGNEHLSVVLDAADTYSHNELYIRYGQLPSRDEYDDSYDLSNTPDQAVEIANTQAGTYYVLVYCDYMYSSFSYTIVAHNNDTMPTLAAGESVSGEMTNSDDARYYQVEVGGNEHLSVVLECTPLELDTGIRYNWATGKGKNS